MQRIECWLDPISPFAYLAFERLPEALAGLSHEVVYRPLLFAGLLGRFGQKGPAEVEPKRQWTFRHVHWMAERHGLVLATPAVHPFNPLPLLRLLVACAPAGGTPSRHAVEAVMRHVWTDEPGADAVAPARVAALASRLAPARDPDGAAVKAELRAATDAAADRGVFGVPTFALGERLFWGVDALPMLADALAGGAWFEGPAWEREGAPRVGVVRR
jgi:2-hydroxychromene-2-carboxylate isomerase